MKGLNPRSHRRFLEKRNRFITPKEMNERARNINQATGDGVALSNHLEPTQQECTASWVVDAVTMCVVGTSEDHLVSDQVGW
jgi:hypothetical protein